MLTIIDRLKWIATFTLATISLYWSISLFCYSLANPELTSMEVFLSSWDAVRWQWLE